MRKITSLSNEKVKHLAELMKKPGLREKEELYVAEGHKMYCEVPEEKLVSTWVTERYLESSPKLSEETKNLFIVSDSVMKSLSDTMTPQGVIMLVRKDRCSLAELIDCKERINKKVPHPLLILEDIKDPGNMGTLIRSAEGAGAGGVVVCGDCVDIYNPKTVRSTMGSIFRVKVAKEKSAKECIKELQRRKTAVYAATPEGKRAYNEIDFTKPAAVIIGNESKGITEEVRFLCDEEICIPMEGKAESLNAGIAGSLFLFEAKRQRDIKNA